MTAGELQDLTINFCKEYCKDFDANPKDRKCVGCIRRHDFQKGALEAQKVFIKEHENQEYENKKNKQLADNRGNFIDWCITHHIEILKEYIGFTEAK